MKGEVPPASSLAPVLANQYPTHNHIVCVALLHTGDAVVVPHASRGVDTVVLGNGETPTGTDAGRGIEAPAIEEWLIGREKMHWVGKDERQTTCVVVRAVQSSQGISRARGRINQQQVSHLTMCSKCWDSQPSQSLQHGLLLLPTKPPTLTPLTPCLMSSPWDTSNHRTPKLVSWSDPQTGYGPARGRSCSGTVAYMAETRHTEQQQRQ